MGVRTARFGLYFYNVIILGRVKLRFNFFRVFKVSKMA